MFTPKELREMILHSTVEQLLVTQEATNFSWAITLDKTELALTEAWWANCHR